MAKSPLEKIAKKIIEKTLQQKATKTVVKKAVRKVVSKKTVKKAARKKIVGKDAYVVKYEDKSRGQPQLLPIFEKIKALLLPYVKGEMKMHGGDGGKIALINNRPLVIDGRKKPGMWFASALVQKGYVGFYYMPVYMNEPVRKQLHPELLKCLKGKACFYIKKEDPVIYAQIKDALKIGFDDYRKKGWV